MSHRVLQVTNHLAPDQEKLTGAMGGTRSIALELLILQRIKLDCIRRRAPVQACVGGPLVRPPYQPAGPRSFAMSLISAANAPGSDVRRRSSMFMRLALPNSESMKQTALAPSNADKLQKSNIGFSESDWADLSTEIMDQIVTLLSDQLMMSSTVWPKDTRIPAVQLLCRHWHNAASE